MALESLVNVFGRDKDQVFDVLIHVFPLPPRLVIKLKKNFVGRITYCYLKRKRLLKPKQRRRSFLIVNLPFKNGSLRLITWVESRALFLLYERNPIEGTEALKDEQLSHYQKKAAVWKGVTIKDKKVTAARSDAAGKDSSSSCSDMKKYDGGSNLKSLHNEGKFSFPKFNLSRLNSQLSPHHLENHHSFDFIILLLLSGYSFSQVI